MSTLPGVMLSSTDCYFWEEQMRGSFAAAMSAALWVIVTGALTASSASLQSLSPTQTPIKYLVVIDDENVSFDHYFATYPNAQNPRGEPSFSPLPNTPSVNNSAGVIATQNL